MDPIEDLASDHRAVQELLAAVERDPAGADPATVGRIARELSVHAAAEELVLYPAVARLVPGGHLLSASHLQEHQLVKELLVAIEKASQEDRTPLLAALAVYVRHHVAHEEGVMFPALRQHSSDRELRDIGASLADAKQIAPTHAHPHAPRRPPANLVAGVVASVVDRARDVVGGRRG